MNEIPFFATSAAFAMRVGQSATTIYHLFDEIGVDLHGAVVRASAALADRPLEPRLEQLGTPLAGGVGASSAALPILGRNQDRSIR